MHLNGFILAFVFVVAAIFVSGGAHGQDVDSGEGPSSHGGGATISGRVTYTDGSPAARRIVEWRPAGDENGGSTTITDENGFYTIFGLQDGVYLVGFFDPKRLPEDRNPELTAVVDHPSPELRAAGVPVGRRVVIRDGKSVYGVDFVITYIGPEVVVGPETTGQEVAGLPASGSSGSASPAWVPPVALAAAGLAGILLGLLALHWSARSRQSST